MPPKEKIKLAKLDSPSVSPYRITKKESVPRITFKGASFSVGDFLKIDTEFDRNDGKGAVLETFGQAEVKDIQKKTAANGIEGVDLIVLDHFWGRSDEIIYGEHIRKIKKLRK